MGRDRVLHPFARGGDWNVAEAVARESAGNMGKRARARGRSGRLHVVPSERPAGAGQTPARGRIASAEGVRKVRAAVGRNREWRPPESAPFITKWSQGGKWQDWSRRPVPRTGAEVIPAAALIREVV